MGQRYIPDSYAFQQLVWDERGRPRNNARTLPMGLDVMTVLGSDQAYRHRQEGLRAGPVHELGKPDQEGQRGVAAKDCRCLGPRPLHRLARVAAAGHGLPGRWRSGLHEVTAPGRARASTPPSAAGPNCATTRSSTRSNRSSRKATGARSPSPPDTWSPTRPSTTRSPNWPRRSARAWSTTTDRRGGAPPSSTT